MTDSGVQAVSGGLLVAAALALAFDIGGVVRVPIIVAFALLSPGLAATRFLPRLDWADRLALAVGISLSLVILVSMLLVALERWNGTRAFVELACITGAMAIMPHWRKPARRTSQPQPTTLRGPDAALRARTQSSNPTERRAGLLELAALLESQGELEWAKELRDGVRDERP